MEIIGGKFNIYKMKSRSSANPYVHKKIERNDAWYTFTHSFMKTLEYPLAATTLTYGEWNSILRPLLKIVLPKTGFARNYKRDVFFGPTKALGLEIIHPWTHQLIAHWTTWLEEAVNNTLTH